MDEPTQSEFRPVPRSGWRPPGGGSSIVILLLLLAIVAVAYLSPSWKTELSQAVQPSTTLSEGEAAYRAGNNALALKLFKSLAEKGNAEAQYRIGMMYEAGAVGDAPDFPNAVAWYEKSAAAGLTEAKVHLGKLYLEGDGVLQNFSKARPLLEQAADDGDASAQFDLGRMAEHGWGEEKSLPMAYAWYEYATRQNFGPARAARDRVLDALSPSEVAEGQDLLKKLAPGVAGAETSPTRPAPTPDATAKPQAQSTPQSETEPAAQQ